MQRHTTCYELRGQAGVTLVELVVVTTILVLLAVAGFDALPGLRRKGDLHSAAEITASLLAEARSRTLSSEEKSQYGVHMQADRIVIFKGTSYATGTAGNVERFLPSTVEIASTTLLGGAQGGGVNVLFKRLTGDTDYYGTILIKEKRDAMSSSTISVGQRGTIAVD